MQNLIPKEKELVNTLKIKTLITTLIALISLYMAFNSPDVLSTIFHPTNPSNTFLTLVFFLFGIMLLFISSVRYKMLQPYKNNKFLPLNPLENSEIETFNQVINDFPELNNFKNECLNKNNLITKFDLDQAILYTQDLLKKRHPYLNFQNNDHK